MLLEDKHLNNRVIRVIMLCFIKKKRAGVIARKIFLKIVKHRINKKGIKLKCVFKT